MTKPKPLLPPEPIWYLRSLSTPAYLQSRWWMQARRTFREAVKDTCQLCGLAADDEADWIKFHVHHVTYEHVGYEHWDDLRLLCAPCHHLIHYPNSHQAQHWLEVRSFAAPDLAEKAAALNPPELRRRTA